MEGCTTQGMQTSSDCGRSHSPVAYQNGQWIDAGLLSVAVDDLGFEMGVTVVERLRTFAGQPYCVEQHIARLRRSLEIVDWDAAALASEAQQASEQPG